MLCPVLRYLYGEIGSVHYFLVHAVDFVTEYEGVLFSLFGGKGVEGNGVDGLLYAYDAVAFGFQPFYGICGPVEIFPRYAEFRSYGRLVDFGGRRGGADSAKAYPVDFEGIGTSEGGAHVVCASDIVENDCDSGVGRGLVFFGSHPVQFDVQQFSVFHNVGGIVRAFSRRGAKVGNFVYFKKI